MKKYTIIGGGLSGMSVLGQLVSRIKNRTSNEPVIIHLYEKTPENIATGMPYNSNNPITWLLNGPPATKFRLLPDGETLREWMDNNNKGGGEFPPRAVIGEYLKAQYEKIKTEAKEQGIIIEERYEEVTQIQKSNDFWEVTTKNGQTDRTDAIMLCFGHLPPDSFHHLKGKNNYLHSPWDVNQLKNIPNNATVHTIGSHLTFIDVAKYLYAENNFKGNIVSVSRNPAIITMRSNNVTMPDDGKALSSMSREVKDTITFSEFQSLFWKTYSDSAKLKETIDPDKLRKTHEASKLLTYQMNKLNNIPNDQVQPYLGDVELLRTFIEKFYFEGAYDAVWKALPEEERENFNKCFYSILLGILVGIPAQSAVALLELYSQNRIIEYSGLKSVEYNDEGKVFILQFEDGTTQIATHIINCTGPGRDVTKHLDTHPLLANLVQSGLINPIKSGGIAIDNANHVINKNGEPVDNFYALGPTVYHGKKLSPYAVYFSCWGAQDAIDSLLSVQENATPKPACF
jgi:uncharacterized NAD(P)/FAD-binding protein YdhS